MKRRARQWQALRQIERDLADWYPGLDALFFAFTQQVQRQQMPRVEKVRTKPFRLLARLRRRPDRRRVTRTGVSGSGP